MVQIHGLLNELRASMSRLLRASSTPRGHVLIVDDDLSMRAFVDELLRNAGYATTVAADGEEALDVAGRCGPIDLLLTDVMMPRMDGYELARRLRQAHPNLKVLYLTGYADRLFDRKAILWENEAFLEKPSTLNEVVEAVSLLLTGHPTPAAAVDARASAAIGDAGGIDASHDGTSAPAAQATMRLSSMGPTARADDHSAAIARALQDRALPIGQVVVVDDCPVNLRLLTQMLARDGHVVRTATNGDEALELVAREHPDVVLMDVMMPGRDGFETCRMLKEATATRLIPIVLVTALRDSKDKLRGLEAGADDFLTKPVNTTELRARVRSLVRLKRYTDELESAEAVMLMLGETVEARDAYTLGHCQRLAEYSVRLGRELGLDEQDLAALEYGGFLHDIGKIGVPDALLLKPAPLTREEYQRMQQHTIVGDRLCGGLRSLSRVRGIVRHHHERLDGSGYPDGLRGDSTPLLAQIIGIADVYDALTTVRPYKSALPPDRAHEELRGEVRRGWRRADLVDTFITSTSA